MENIITYEVKGENALFSDPATKLGGERASYQVPTYGALLGITKAIYWKPSIVYRIRKVRIMNRIAYQSRGVSMIKYNSSVHDPMYQTYLKDVRYQVEAEMILNRNRPEYSDDWDMKKHLAMFQNALRKGGRMAVCLGMSECYADVVPCAFGSGEGYYDNTDMEFGMMVHCYVYPDEGWDAVTRTHLSKTIWMPVMTNGVITFPTPQECPICKQIKPMKKKEFERKNGKEKT